MGAWVLSGIPMAVLLIAGLAKLGDLPAFADALKTWQLVPSWSKPVVLHLIPGTELVLGGAWLLGMHRRFCVAGAAVLFAGLSAVFAAEWHLGAAPSCGCLGAAGRALPVLESPEAVMVRNVAMLLMLAVGGVVHASSRWQRRADGGPRPSRHGGFTLIEVLLVVVLVGLLIALAAPSMASIRERAKRTASLSNLRQHAAILTAYAADHAEHLPFVTVPGATLTVLRCSSAGIALPVGYFQASWAWHIELADGYYDGAVFGSAFKSPLGERGRPAIENSYELACSFLADPAYYNQETRLGTTEQLRATRLAEVLFPSDKALLVDAWPRAWGLAPEHVRRLAASVDGAAADIPGSKFGRQVPTGDGVMTLEQGGHPSGMSWPLQHALDGVRGRDILR